MQHRIPDQTGSSANRQRAIVVYENVAARENALNFCNCLVRPVPQDDWFSFNGLSHAHAADDAVEKAAVADMIIFALQSEGDLPREVKLWIERWLGKRNAREGAIVGLVSEKPGSVAELASLKEVYLRHTAHRASMDYLSHTLPTDGKAMPDSLDAYRERAGQMTSVLDQILHKRTPSVPPL